LIIILFILLVLFFILRIELREACLKALLALSTIILIVTEAASTLHLLSRGTLLFCYIVLILGFISFLFLNREQLWSALMKLGSPQLTISQKLILFSSGVTMAIALCTALLSAPNNWDSMVYHLARIPYWIQQGHVGHFPAHVTRQLGFPPLSEYIMMHSLLLSDSDRFLNIYQWLFSLGSILSVSLVAKYLNFSKQVQIISILVASTTPMLIMQSSSTQNDIVNSFFLLSTLTFILKYRQSSRKIDLIFIALSAGLALLTKGTAYIYLLPMAIWTLVLFFRSERKSWNTALIGLLTILLINTGHWWRNYSVFDNPLGPDTHTMSYFHPKAIASNLIRNSVMELSTGYETINTFLAKATYKLHQTIGIDQNDSRTTWSGSMPFEIRPLRLQEDYANNPFHFTFFFIALVYLLLKREKSRLLWPYTLVLIIAFILLSSLLEWQVWHNRLHLSFILMTVPISAYVLSRFKFLQYIVLILLTLFAVKAGFNNESRMLYGDKAIWKKTRMEQYFSTRPDMLKDWNIIDEKLRQEEGNRLGVIGSAAIWDYPTWFILNKNKRFTISNIRVRNASSKLESNEFIPDVILVNKVSMEDNFTYKNKRFIRSIQSGELSFYEIADY